jgi:dephospho-CoA kinase
MVVLGVAGPLASGKSSVVEMLHDCGAATLRADDVSRELLQPGQATLAQVRRTFGAEFFRPDGTLHRSKLAALIFADPQARKRLNAIMHPPMVARLKEKLDAYRSQPTPPAVVAIEAAILHQMGLDRLSDRILRVTAPQAVRIRRLQQRDVLDAQEAEQRVRVHDEMGLGDLAADYVIDTSGELADTRRQVEQLWERLTGSG